MAMFGYCLGIFLIQCILISGTQSEKDISHIENANLDDVKAFYNKFYMPNNAILCIAGNVETENVKALCEKYFGNIEREKIFRGIKQRNQFKEIQES